MASDAQTVITNLYRAVEGMKRSVKEDQEFVNLLTAADYLVDIELCTESSLSEHVRNLRAAQAKLQDLEGKLSRTSDYWREKGYEAEYGQPWLDPAQPVGQPPAEPSSTATAFAAKPAPAIPDLRDPKVGSWARWAKYPLSFISSSSAEPAVEATIDPTLTVKSTPDVAAPKARPNVRAWRDHAWWMGNDRMEKHIVRDCGTARIFRHTPQRFHRPGYVPRHERPSGLGHYMDAGHNLNDGYRLNHLDIPHVPGYSNFEPLFWETQLQHRGDIYARSFTLFRSETTKVGHENAPIDKYGPLGRLGDWSSMQPRGRPDFPRRDEHNSFAVAAREQAARGTRGLGYQSEPPRAWREWSTASESMSAPEPSSGTPRPTHFFH